VLTDSGVTVSNNVVFDEHQTCLHRTLHAEGEVKEVPAEIVPASAVFGIEEPLSIFSIHIEDIDFLNIDSSIWDSSILRSIEDIDNIENHNQSTKFDCCEAEYRCPSPP
jgi:2'-5' RNA ligase